MTVKINVSKQYLLSRKDQIPSPPYTHTHTHIHTQINKKNKKINNSSRSTTYQFKLIKKGGYINIDRMLAGMWEEFNKQTMQSISFSSTFILFLI